MEIITKYLKETLGITAGYNKLNPVMLSKLPFYITKEYEFGTIELFNRQVIVMKVKGEFTVEKLYNQAANVKRIFNKLVLIEIPAVEAYQRQRLIDKRVSFVMPGKQIFFPDLMISLQEYGLRKIEDEMPDEMYPAAQYILLYHLLVKPVVGLNFANIAKELCLYPMAVTRAAYYLHNIKICKIEGTKDKTLKFNKAGKELWLMAESRMVSPVKKGLFYSGYSLDKNVRKANINALAYYTNLNDDPVEYYAMRPGYSRFIGGANLKPVGKLEGNIFIEEWKYDPALLTKTDYVDPLSLYLCFRENRDERIEAALDELINKIKW